MTRPHQPEPAIDARDFPALREFLRGYFHQDMGDEHKSPADAALQFCQDADSAQLGAVAREWRRFLERMKDHPLEAINRQLTSTLGSAYFFSSMHDVHRVSAVFAAASPDA